ncbi:MAG: four helix bundle protein [Bacteroidales bacterium]|nr:four helix bundle protein [Bacteroidales bacterium]MCF8344655.1 four helix bundle protein [Bacteroidales bacterium]MCF8376217.1 four helix bundle protein [Bacteroidales bacterium]MCF8402244.1 four helix bundle protein [Bacteroidales bacterium]
MRNFRHYEIWKQSMTLVKDIYRHSLQLPDTEKFGLRSQITRSAVSIPSNIAEGCSRRTDADFSRFLEIALGSAFELETQIILMKDLNFFDVEEYNKTITQLHSLQKQINTLIQKIKNVNAKSQ